MFLKFTWPAPLLYYTGDDMMNLNNYWTTPLPELIKANVFFWSTYVRPFGGVVYLPLYYIFGFNPRPLYIVYYLFLLTNLYLAYLLARRITRSSQIGVLTVLLWCVHGKLDYLYYNAGSLYDVCCFTFFALAFAVYLAARERGEYVHGWRLAVMLIAFVGCLDSKEMGASLPVILLLYELFANPPRAFQWKPLVRWLTHEGRGALVTALFVLAYIPGRLASGGLGGIEAYQPKFTGARYLSNIQTYWADIFYHNAPFTDATPLGVAPLSVPAVLGIYLALIALAVAMRSRWMFFGLLFFQFALLPVSFAPARLGFVLYIPLFGLALYAAVLLVALKDKLLAVLSWRSDNREFIAMTALFLVTAGVLIRVHARHWNPAPDNKYSKYRMTVRELLRQHPSMPPAAKLLFIHDPFEDTYDLAFLVRLYYRDKDIFITQLNGPVGQRIPVDKLGTYDHVFSYDYGAWTEYDNKDIRQALRYHVLRNEPPLGESVTVGTPGDKQYFVKDVLMGQPGGAYWTLDNPELKFQLSSTTNRTLKLHITIVGEVLKQTGPQHVEYFVNGKLLDRVTYTKEGETDFRHAVPREWLSTDGYTVVKVHFPNPYVAPADHARLGFLLGAAGFE